MEKTVSSSAMMVFFKCKSCGSEDLLKDLESFLTDLKNIEAMQPELDEVAVEEITRSGRDRVVKDTTAEVVHCDDIETLVNDLSFMESDDGVAMQHSNISEASVCGADNDSSCNNPKDVMQSCQKQNSYQTQKRQINDRKRGRLKYSFRMDHEVGRLEKLLKEHNVPHDVLQTLRKSLLFNK